MSIVVRYLKDDTLMERCIGRKYQSNLKDKALADTILSHLKFLYLSLEKMIDQALMERVLCPGKKRRSSDCKIVLLTSCICLLFGTCIEFSFGKVLCNT